MEPITVGINGQWRVSTAETPGEPWPFETLIFQVWMGSREGGTYCDPGTLPPAFHQPWSSEAEARIGHDKVAHALFDTHFFSGRVTVGMDGLPVMDAEGWQAHLRATRSARLHRLDVDYPEPYINPYLRKPYRSAFSRRVEAEANEREAKAASANVAVNLAEIPATPITPKPAQRPRAKKGK